MLVYIYTCILLLLIFGGVRVDPYHIMLETVLCDQLPLRQYSMFCSL